MRGLSISLMLVVVAPAIITGVEKYLIVMIDKNIFPIRCSEGQQKSRHGHLSYNLEGLGHVPHRAPINVTAVTGVSGGLDN